MTNPHDSIREVSRWFIRPCAWLAGAGGVIQNPLKAQRRRSN
ncbi:DUF1317 domain-containing protein [Klebsiella pneumoniae]|nr:DUF1317 domain-containing protein [Klebsiella pneumoniae]